MVDDLHIEIRRGRDLVWAPRNCILFEYANSAELTKKA